MMNVWNVFWYDVIFHYFQHLWVSPGCIMIPGPGPSTVSTLHIQNPGYKLNKVSGILSKCFRVSNHRHHSTFNIQVSSLCINVFIKLIRNSFHVRLVAAGCWDWIWWPAFIGAKNNSRYTVLRFSDPYLIKISSDKCNIDCYNLTQPRLCKWCAVILSTPGTTWEVAELGRVVLVTSLP